MNRDVSEIPGAGFCGTIRLAPLGRLRVVLAGQRYRTVQDATPEPRVGPWQLPRRALWYRTFPGLRWPGQARRSAR